MFITQAEAEIFNESSLKDFIAKEIPEGSYLDYKKALSDGKKDRYQEFLKDVTAFANANGGDILIGVKEPQDGLSIDEQIIGIDDGKTIAESLERVSSSSIQPRISGLKIYPIQLSNSKYVLLIHIPPSLSKPHMVDHQRSKTHSFYIRHRESIQPMTTHEIREAVLNSATAVGRAQAYMEEMEAEARDSVASQPAFIFQVMPLIKPETLLNVLDTRIIEIIERVSSKEIENIFKKDDFYYKFECNIRPYPTIKGIQGKNEIGNIRYVINFHRNGYIDVCYIIDKVRFENKMIYSLDRGAMDIFKSFLFLCGTLLRTIGFDTTYILSNKFVNALNIFLIHDNRYGYKTKTQYGRMEIIWDTQIKQPGDSFMPIANKWFEQMYHAFGKYPPEI